MLQHWDDIRSHVDGFYRDLFSLSVWGGVALAPHIWTGAQLLLELENAALLAPFSEEEVLAAIKGMNPASAPGPDSLPVHFFQVFWTSIKAEMMAMF